MVALAGTKPPVSRQKLSLAECEGSGGGRPREDGFRRLEGRYGVRMPMGDQFWGDRCGTVADPHGYSWTIATHKEDLTREEMQQRSEEFFKQFAQQSAHT